jgi:hypothetical protein
MLVAPADVAENGLGCNCTCPGCGSALVLKEGTKRRHFAHYEATGERHCVESAIHAAAIQVLLEANWLNVPEKFVNAGVKTNSGSTHAKFQTLSPARCIRFDSSRKEQSFQSPSDQTIRADVVGFRADRKMLVEMCFTHAVDEEKLQIIRELGLPAIEIDLNSIDLDNGIAGVRERVLEDTGFKRWLFYPGEIEARDALLRVIEQEVVEINAAYFAKQAKEERQRQAREDRKKAQDQEKQVALDRYRSLTTEEKELRLRNQLGIAGSWPRHLQVMNMTNDAIAAPPRLWQASLFYRFVYRKPINFDFTLNQATSWVKERFDARPETGLSVMKAVQSFLGYLKGCGFLKREYNPYDSDSYRILYNDLLPPPRVKGKSDFHQLPVKPGRR